MKVRRGHQLNADIAERGGFNRTCHHGNAAGIRAELVQQLVLAAAAHDMQLRERFAAKVSQLAQDVGIEQGETVKMQRASSAGREGTGCPASKQAAPGFQRSCAPD